MSCQATPRTRQDYRLKKFITLDPTVGSGSNFYRSFKRLVSLTSEWNHHKTSVVSGRARPPTGREYRSWIMPITFDPTVGSCLIFYRSFRRQFSFASLRNCYSKTPSSDRDRPPPRQEYRLHRSITPTTSRPATPPTRPEYQVTRSVTLDSTIGSCSNFNTSF